MLMPFCIDLSLLACGVAMFFLLMVRMPSGCGSGSLVGFEAVASGRRTVPHCDVCVKAVGEEATGSLSGLCL